MSAPERKAAPERTLRFRLPCASAVEFLEKYAAVIAARGLFVPMIERPPAGTACRLELSFLGAGPKVRGEAFVSRHARSGERIGVMMQFRQLDPESLQFPLLPPRVSGEPEAALVKLAEFRPPSVPWDEEKTPAIPVSSSAIDASRDLADALDERTRVHGYTSVELAAAKNPDAWGGGLLPFDQLRNYQLLRRVGTGGMAEVFLARCALGNGAEKLVALKMVLPEFGPGSPFATLFLNEARVSAGLQHANLVQVFDTGEAAGRGYLAMEYVHGRSLAAVIRKLRALGTPPPLGLAVAVAVELCQALEYLHTQRGLDGRLLNLVHRDLSPGNILISELGELKLVDFGVAAATAESAPEEVVVGKRAYMAPEQAAGEAPTPMWDLYSLGVILHELLTLEQLFDGETPTAAQLPPSSSNPQVPAKLDRLVLWLTDPSPVRRAQTASAVLKMLDGIRDHVPRCDLRRLVAELFGEELRTERIETERMIAIARERGGWVVPTPREGPFRHLARLRRRVQTTHAWRQLTRHRRPLQWVAGALAVQLVIIGPLAFLRYRQQRQIAQVVAQLDARVQHGQLAGPGGNSALDALTELRRLDADDPRTRRRVRQLGDLFVTLAKAAEVRGDLGEAAVHYQAALNADPTRAAVRERLARIESEVRKHTTAESASP